MPNAHTAHDLLICIRQLATDPAITDTIWLPNGTVTVVEKLAQLAADAGATDGEIEAAVAGENVPPLADSVVRETIDSVANQRDRLFTALHYLLQQTVDMDLNHGVQLTEGESDARTKALAAMEYAASDA